MRQSLLRLFKAVQIEDTNRSNKFSQKNLERMISHGYILDPKIFVSDQLLNEIEETLGLSGKNVNASFHKSWKIVNDGNIVDLVIQQIMHYFTTYGFEKLGIYNENFVYIPNEELKIPEITGDIKLTYIKGLTSQNILKKIIDLGSGIALADQTIRDIMNVVEFNNYASLFVKNIKNRELLIRLYDFYGIAPKNPIEYLQYMIYKTTGKTLLIKDRQTIQALKLSDSETIDRLIELAPKNLATIFFRFKPLFLALKYASNNKTFFNQLRKQADQLHIPFKPDYLSVVTEKIKDGELSMHRLEKELKNVNTFRKIRLARALNFRLNHNGNIVYRVRNGKGWVSEFSWEKGLIGETTEALRIVLNSIVEDIKDKVQDKVFYIPEDISYAIPSSEKQFMGNIPNNSYLKTKNDTIVGIHWKNTDQRVDLDLSLIDSDRKYGWDGSYRSYERDILFSGDMTTAPLPNGASESFYLKKEQRLPKIVFVNYYNFFGGEQSMCQLFIANEKPVVFNKNYVVNINNIIGKTEINLDTKETTLGFVISINGENRFYFSNTGIGKEITSSKGRVSEMALNYFIATCSSNIHLEDILLKAGAKIIRNPEEEFDFDFSLEKIDKTDLINIFQ